MHADMRMNNSKRSDHSSAARCVTHLCREREQLLSKYRQCRHEFFASSEVRMDSGGCGISSAGSYLPKEAVVVTQSGKQLPRENPCQQ